MEEKYGELNRYLLVQPCVAIEWLNQVKQIGGLLLLLPLSSLSIN